MKTRLPPPQHSPPAFSRPPFRLSRLALLVLLAGSATWFSRSFWLPAIGLTKPDPRTAQGPNLAAPLWIDPRSLDLGDVFEAKRVNRKLKIENISDRSISIERLDASCSCVGIQPQHLRLPPGGTAEIELMLDLSRPPAVMHDARAWERRLPIRAVGAKTAGEPLLGQWIIRSKIKAVLMADPGMAHFDDLTQGQAGAAIHIALRPTIPADKIVLISSPAWLACSISKVDRQFELIVQPKPMEKAGTFQGEIDIDLLDSEGKATCRQGIKARVKVLEKVAALPADVAFGVIQVGREVSQTIAIVPRVAGELRATGVDAGKDSVATVEGREGRLLVHLRRTVRERGQGKSLITLQTQLGNEPVSISVPVSWYGEMADFAPDRHERTAVSK